MALQQEKVKLPRKLGKNTSLFEKIHELPASLKPYNFLNYLDFLELDDFRFHNCEEDEFFDAFGMLSLPKTMAVTSRIDLTLEKPVAKGKLIYKSGDFETDLAKLF